MNQRGTILVTGATGYVGGRLVPRLLQMGLAVRVLVRDPGRLQGRAWASQVDIVKGDVLQRHTLPGAMEGVSAAYYLIHSMGKHDDLMQRELDAARNFGLAAAEAGVEQLIYLGGLGDPASDLSEHLRSRQLTGEALQEGGVPVTEFRAAVIVGSGSISFEMIRTLTELIPIMVCPRWVFTQIQPISIDDVLHYLSAALETPACRGQVVEIGGADVQTYGDMMLGYADVRGLRRWLLPVPVLTPHLSSYWVHWMTPIPAAIARHLIEGLRNEVIVREPKAANLFPEIHPVGYQSAVQRALEHLTAGEVETSWSDSLSSSQWEASPVVLQIREGMIVEQRMREVPAPADALYRAFTGLGGEHGWLSYGWAWQLRGILDRLAGGVGFRRGRRDPDALRVGDALDFWRVEALEPGHLLRLRAEMKVPGRAWLQFEAEPQDDGRTVLIQKAFFAPKGLFGWLYWYGLYPLHAVIFSSLVGKVAELGMNLDQAG